MGKKEQDRPKNPNSSNRQVFFQRQNLQGVEWNRPKKYSLGQERTLLDTKAISSLEASWNLPCTQAVMLLVYKNY